MNELSYYILDIFQNSINALSKNIILSVEETDEKITICISDDGIGMDTNELNACVSPFYTTGNKKIGLGLSLFKEVCELANGYFEIKSKKNEGTIVKGVLYKESLNCLPLGNLIETMVSIFCFSKTDVRISYQYNDDSFMLDTVSLKNKYEGLELQTPIVIKWLKEYLSQELIRINNKFSNTMEEKNEIFRRLKENKR